MWSGIIAVGDDCVPPGGSYVQAVGRSVCGRVGDVATDAPSTCTGLGENVSIGFSLPCVAAVADCTIPKVWFNSLTMWPSILE